MEREGFGSGHVSYNQWHITHCIELLRQSLMCRPDLTLEVKNKTLGGVTGFGTGHVCLDWEQLLDWVSKQESVVI